MRRGLLCLVAISLSASRATSNASTYQQTIQPVRIGAVIEYIQFQLKNAVSAAYKSGIDITRESSTSVSFKSPAPSPSSGLACQDSLKNASIKVYINRSIQMVGSDRKITEQLAINRCGERKIIFAAERLGSNIEPADDTSLLRGEFPIFDDARIYNLALADEAFSLKRSQLSGHQEMTVLINTLYNKNLNFELTLKEDSTPIGSLRQSLDVVIWRNERAVGSWSMQYNWKVGTGPNAVPRLFLYVENEEVSPKAYLESVDEILSNGVYTWIPGLVTRVVF